MTSDKGVILTVGIRCNGDRTAIVIPIATDNTGMDKKTLCDQAIEDFEPTTLDKICACLSEDAYVTHTQAVGMDNAFIPRRRDFAPEDYPGLRAAICETSQVAGLLAFYSEPDDLEEGGRVRVGKNFISGFPDEDLSGDALSSGLVTALDACAQWLAEGWTNSASGGGKWYRVVSAPPKGSAAAPLIRTGAWDTRGYTGTQRRRLIPH